jgi:hypothetical protein
MVLGALGGRYVGRSGILNEWTYDNSGSILARLTAETEPGMSGGPAVDVCGVVFGVLSLGGGNESIALRLNAAEVATLEDLSRATPRAFPTATPTATASPRINSALVTLILEAHFKAQEKLATTTFAEWFTAYRRSGNSDYLAQANDWAKDTALWEARLNGTYGKPRYLGEGIWLQTLVNIVPRENVLGVTHSGTEQWYVYEDERIDPRLR